MAKGSNSYLKQWAADWREIDEAWLRDAEYYGSIGGGDANSLYDPCDKLYRLSAGRALENHAMDCSACNQYLMRSPRIGWREWCAIQRQEQKADALHRIEYLLDEVRAAYLAAA